MPPRDETSRFDWLLDITLFGARAGFAGGLGVAAGELSSGFAPLAWEGPIFVVSGATCTAFFCWISTRIVRNGQRVDRGRPEGRK